MSKTIQLLLGAGFCAACGACGEAEARPFWSEAPVGIPSGTSVLEPLPGTQVTFTRHVSTVIATVVGKPWVGLEKARTPGDLWAQIASTPPAAGTGGAPKIAGRRPQSTENYCQTGWLRDWLDVGQGNSTYRTSGVNETSTWLDEAAEVAPKRSYMAAACALRGDTNISLWHSVGREITTATSCQVEAAGKEFCLILAEERCPEDGADETDCNRYFAHFGALVTRSPAPVFHRVTAGFGK